MSDLDSILNDALDELDIEDKKQQQQINNIQQSTTQSQSLQNTNTNTQQVNNTTQQQPTTNNNVNNNNAEPSQEATAEFDSFLKELQSSELGQQLMSQFNTNDNVISNTTSNNKTTTQTNNNNTNTTSSSSSNAIEQAIRMISEGNKDNNNNAPGLPDFSNDSDMSEMLQKLLGEMSGSGEGGNEGGIDSMIETLMSSMLSKDVLYQPMKDITDRYPQWLSDNKTKLSDEQYNTYSKQLDILQQICHTFEHDENNTTKIMQLMNDMQQYGQPPQELIPVDESGNSQSPFDMGALGGLNNSINNNNNTSTTTTPNTNNPLADLNDPQMQKMIEEGCKQQ